MLKEFKVKTIAYIVAIFAAGILLAVSLSKQGFTASLVLLVPILVSLLIAFFRLVDKTNQEVATFLNNIKYNDFAVNFSENTPSGESFKTLHGAFNLVSEKFRDIRSQKEAQFQYLQSIIENVDTGLICFDIDKKTILYNRALQGLLHKSYFPNLESVKLYNNALHKALVEVKPGENKLLKLLISGNIVQLSIRKTTIKLADNEFHLYSIQNIHTELENQEVESWQKLIRILTHEIMNSVAPVVSLSATAEQLLEEEDFTPDDRADLARATSAIRRRASGLLEFTETYRQLTKVPAPKFEQVYICELIQSVLDLLKPETIKLLVAIETAFPTRDIPCLLDPALIEQVLINIIKNGMQALHGVSDALILISVNKLEDEKVEISIKDNGPGIPPDILENIFIPFFTTKKEGTGIGLSLSRQIIHSHKGSIHATSEVGKGTTFMITV